MGFTTTAAFVVLSCGALGAPPDGGDDDYRFIVGLCEQGLYDMAAKEAADFLREHRGHERVRHARYRLATSLFELGRRGEAREHFERLSGADDFEFAGEVAFRLGQIELDAERWAAAAEAFERALASSSDYLRWPALQWAGDAYFGLERYDAAEERYAAVLGSSAEGAREWRAEAARGLAWCAFRTERWDACIERAERGREETRARGGRAEALAELDFLVGEAELEAGRPERALDALARVGTGPFVAAALRARGFALAELDRHAAAADVFAELVRLDERGPFAAEAALWVGVSGFEAGEYERARAALEHECVPPTAEALLWRARAELASGDPTRAVATVGRAERQADAAGRRAELAAVHGEALVALDRADEAARAFERAGDDYGAHAAAIAWLTADRPDEAIRVARAHLSRRGPDGAYRRRLELALGEALFVSQRFDEARAVFAGLLDPERAIPADLAARALSRSGWCHYESGRLDDASAAFATLSREHPSAPEADEALYMWGRAECDAGRSEAAASVWERYLDDPGRDIHRVDCLLGLSEVEEGPEREARLSEVVRLADDERAARALFELAESRAARGERERAEADYRRLLAEHADSPRAPAARYGLAWAHFEAERWALAIGELEQVLAADVAPDLRRAALELTVWCQRAQGRPEAAFGAFRDLTQLCTDERRIFEAGHATAQVFAEAGRADFAAALYDELVRGLDDAPWRAAARVERAYLALDDGDRALADEQVREALASVPDHPGALEAAFFVAEAHYDAGADERAIDGYRRAAASADAPAAEEARYKLGFTLLRAGRPAEAAVEFERLADDHPRSELRGESLFLAGEAHVRAGAFEAGARRLQQALDEYPRHATRPKALFRLGLASGELGRWAECERALTELARGAPDFEHRAEAELWRGRALAAQGNARAARAAWNRVLELDRGVLAARARLAIGRAERAAGDGEAALSEFLKVALLFAHEDEVAEALWLAGCTLAEGGDAEQAAEQFEKLVDEHPETAWAQRARERLSGGSF